MVGLVAQEIDGSRGVRTGRGSCRLAAGRLATDGCGLGGGRGALGGEWALGVVRGEGVGGSRGSEERSSHERCLRLM